MDQAELQLKQQELQIDAQKAGAKLAADRKIQNTKLDLELGKVKLEANKKPKE